MKNQLLVSIAVSLLVMAMATATASAATCGKYTIDGDPSDWGLDLSNDWSVESNWLPNTGVTFVVEDNRDPSYGGITGVHIRGSGSTYVPYDEPKIQHRDGFWTVEPYGGENYDMEALYFDDESDCIYALVVTSVKEDAVGDDNRPGDLALNLDSDFSTGEDGYEYGVKLGKNWLTQFDIYYMPDWEPSVYFPDVKPTIFKSGSSKTGSAIGAYVDTGISDNSKTNYVVEVAIPKSLVGDPGNVGMNQLHISDQCGNDFIPAPEFLFALLPVAIIGLVLGFAHTSAKRRIM